jgi:hypothetical protein
MDTSKTKELQERKKGNKLTLYYACDAPALADMRKVKKVSHTHKGNQLLSLAGTPYHLALYHSHFFFFFLSRPYDEWIVEMMVMALGETCWNNEAGRVSLGGPTNWDRICLKRTQNIYISADFAFIRSSSRR